MEWGVLLRRTWPPSSPLLLQRRSPRDSPAQLCSGEAYLWCPHTNTQLHTARRILNVHLWCTPSNRQHRTALRRGERLPLDSAPRSWFTMVYHRHTHPPAASLCLVDLPHLVGASFTEPCLPSASSLLHSLSFPPSPPARSVRTCSIKRVSRRGGRKRQDELDPSLAAVADVREQVQVQDSRSLQWWQEELVREWEEESLARREGVLRPTGSSPYQHTPPPPQKPTSSPPPAALAAAAAPAAVGAAAAAAAPAAAGRRAGRRGEAGEDWQEDGESLDGKQVQEAKQAVAELLVAGEKIEEEIRRLGREGRLDRTLLVVISNRLKQARDDKERHVAQCMDLLFRRIQAEMEARDSTPAMRLLNDMLHLRDDTSASAHSAWLAECQQIMRDAFLPESDPFSFIVPLGFDPQQASGPINLDPSVDDGLLLRIDFIREVDALIKEVEGTLLPALKELDMSSEGIAVKLQVEEKLRVLSQVRELRDAAVLLKL